MKLKTLRRLSGVICAVLIAALMCCMVSASDSYREGDAVVIRFDSVPAIARAISSIYGLNAGFLDGSLECRFFIEPGIFTMDFDETQRFSADDYKYMKIKCFCNTLLKTSNVYYATDLSPTLDGTKSFNFKRGVNNKWKEITVDLSSYSNWTGNITAIRFDVITKYAAELDQYAFIEYIAFFKTEAEADAFGGLSEAQENGTDLISRYAEGYRTSRVDSITYTVPGGARGDNGEETTASPSSEPTQPKTGGLSTGAAVIIVIAAAALAAVIVVIALRTPGKKPDGADKPKQ